MLHAHFEAGLEHVRVFEFTVYAGRTPRGSRRRSRLVARGVSPDHNDAVLGLINIITIWWRNIHTPHACVGGGSKQPYIHEQAYVRRARLLRAFSATCARSGVVEVPGDASRSRVAAHSVGRS